MNHWECKTGDLLPPDYFSVPHSLWALAYHGQDLPVLFTRKAVGLPWHCEATGVTNFKFKP